MTTDNEHSGTLRTDYEADLAPTGVRSCTS